MNNKETIEKINSLIVETMQAGTVPWSPEWFCTSTANAITGRGYRGINAFLLPLIQKIKGYPTGQWLTFNQARQAGGRVLAGEKGAKVYFWSFFQVGDAPRLGEEDNRRQMAYLKEYTVFNIAQTEGIPASKIKGQEPKVFSPVENYEGGPSIIEDGSNPRYYPHNDTIYLPRAWTSEEGKFQTVYHELAHSTGHSSRLDRDLSHAFGTKEYAREELVAEMASAYACALSGQSWKVSSCAAYLTSWIGKVKDDPMMFIWASSRAEKAAKMILGIKEEEEQDAHVEQEKAS